MYLFSFFALSFAIVTTGWIEDAWQVEVAQWYINGRVCWISYIFEKVNLIGY